MSKLYRTPGVYVEEISFRHLAIAQVETAIPAFVGYTEKADVNGKSVLNRAIKVNSMTEFKAYFGSQFSPTFSLTHPNNPDQSILNIAGKSHGINLLPSQRAYLYDAVVDFFANGGRTCHIVSVGIFLGKKEVKIKKDALLGIQSSSLGNPKPKGLKSIENVKEVTLLAIPDAVALGDGAFEVYREMLAHCQKVGNRFAILDIPDGYKKRNSNGDWIRKFRNGIGNDHLSWGAAYYPWLVRVENPQTLTYKNLDSSINLRELLPEPKAKEILDSPEMSSELMHQALWKSSPSYLQLIETMGKILKACPPSGAIAGIYAKMDSARGVWKAPAGIGLAGFEKPTLSISDEEQGPLNIDIQSGKSINAIRHFPEKGVLVWGARTLAGNDPEWKYIPVKRTALMIKESIENSISQFVFEPNDANTWARIKMLVSDFLFGLWRQGAFLGSKADESYFVKMGLGETMTEQDVIEGKGILIIGFALIKPAEFHVLKIEMKFE